MPAFLDPECFTVRAGPDATEYGKPWRSCCSMNVQHDRKVYLYAVAGDLVLRDALDAIAAVRAEAPRHGWTGILWHREKTRQDGSRYTHIAEIPIA